MSLNGFASGLASGIGQGVDMYEKMPGMVGDGGTADNPGKGASKAASENAYKRAMQQHWLSQDKNGTKSGYNPFDPSTIASAPTGGLANGTVVAPAGSALAASLNDPSASSVTADGTTYGPEFARGGMVKAYADGGTVEPDDQQGETAPLPDIQSAPLPAPQPSAAISSPIDGSSIDPNTGDPATLQQQALAEPNASEQVAPQPQQDTPPQQYQTVLQAAAGEALHYNQDAYQLHGSEKPGAVGAAPNANQKAFASKADVDGQPMKFTPEEASSIEKAIDPNGDLSQAQRSMFALQKGYEYYRNKGDPAQASRFAAMWVNTSAEASQKLGAQAQALLKDGDQTGAVHKLLQAYNVVPNGQSATITTGQDGQPRVLLQDNSGKALGAFPITPAAIFDMANRTRVGNTVWNSMVQAAQGGYSAMLADKAKQASVVANQHTPYVPDASGGVPVGPSGVPMQAPAQQGSPVSPSQSTQAAVPAPAPAPAPVQGSANTSPIASPAAQPPQAPAGMQFKGFDPQSNAVFVDSDGDLHMSDGTDVDDATQLSPQPQAPAVPVAPSGQSAVPVQQPQPSPVTQQGNPNFIIPQRTVLLSGDDAAQRPALPVHYAPSTVEIKGAQDSGDPAAASKLAAAYHLRNQQIDTDYKQQQADYTSKTKGNGLKPLAVNDAETGNKIMSSINDGFDSAIKQLPDPAAPGKTFADAKDGGQSFMRPIAPAIKAVAKDILLHNNDMRDGDTAVQTAMTLVAPDDKDPNAATFRPVGYTADHAGVVIRMKDGTQLAVSLPAYQKIASTHAQLGDMFRGAVMQANQPNQYVSQAKDALSKIQAGTKMGFNSSEVALAAHDRATRQAELQSAVPVDQ